MADESSLPFFDRTATAAGGFPVGRRGYDKDRRGRVRPRLEAQLADTQAEAGRAAGELGADGKRSSTRPSASSTPVANPSYAGLGDRAAQILRLAQDQASEALEEAKREADDLKAAAAKEVPPPGPPVSARRQDIRTVALNEIRQPAPYRRGRCGGDQADRRDRGRRGPGRRPAEGRAAAAHRGVAGQHVEERRAARGGEDPHRDPAGVRRTAGPAGRRARAAGQGAGRQALPDRRRHREPDHPDARGRRAVRAPGGRGDRAGDQDPRAGRGIRRAHADPGPPRGRAAAHLRADPVRGGAGERGRRGRAVRR